MPSGPPSEAEDSLPESAVEHALSSFGPEFRQFAKWIFGPDGVASVQIIAFGDFSHGKRRWPNIVLRRNTAGPMKFQSLSLYLRETDEAVRDYYEVLEVCPTGPLWDVTWAYTAGHEVGIEVDPGQL